MTVCAEFDAAADAKRALDALTSLGYTHIETHTPFPLTEEDAHAPRGWFVAAFLGFVAGLSALAAAYLIQWYANVGSYPLDIGGRPVHAAPAFIPATFETVCLAGTLALFVVFLIAERLPRLWQPIFEIEGFERASIDRFWIVLELRGSSGAAERALDDLARMGPLRIVVGEDET